MKKKINAYEIKKNNNDNINKIVLPVLIFLIIYIAIMVYLRVKYDKGSTANTAGVYMGLILFFICVVFTPVTVGVITAVVRYLTSAYRGIKKNPTL